MTNEEFAKKQDELLDQVPKEFHGALSYMAYESGHARGHDEVLSHLIDYIDHLKDSIENFGTRKFEEGRDYNNPHNLDNNNYFS
jgi:hypothetical protein